MKILVFGYGNKSTLAVSSILLNLSKTIASNSETTIYLYGYDDSKHIKDVSKNIKIYSIKNPFVKGNLSVYRVKRKLSKLFHNDESLISWKKIYKNALKLFKEEKFDYIFGAAGYFMYVQAAYEYSKKTNTKFGILYFDSFTLNSGATNPKKRLKIEKKWYEQADSIFVNEEAAKLPFEDSKNIVHNFVIPVFLKEYKSVRKGPIIYGGVFYENIRPESIINEFINEVLPKDEELHIYSDNYVDQKRDNVVCHQLLDSDSFQKVCLDSKAIVIIGNNKEDVLPSKLLDSISYQKPIIYLNFKKIPDSLSSLPLFFDGTDRNVFEKIKNYKEGQLDLYKILPERNPSILFTQIIDTINKAQ